MVSSTVAIRLVLAESSVRFLTSGAMRTEMPDSRSPRSPQLALIRHTLLFVCFIAINTTVAGAVAAEEPAASEPGAEAEAEAKDTAEDTDAEVARAADETAAYTRSEEAYGSEASSEDAESSRLPPASYYQVGFSHQFETDVADGGNFHMWSGFLDGVYDVDFTDRWAVVTRFDYRADVYEFDDAPLVGGFALLQWGAIHTPRVEMLGAYRFGDAWRVYAGPVLEFSLEGGANTRDSFRPGGLAAAEWTINEDLRVGLGVLAVADLDSSAYVSPILLADWNITDSLALHMESWTTRGGDLELGWRPWDQLEIAASIGFHREYYRLSERDDGAIIPAPGPQPIHISDGLVRDSAYTAGGRVSYLPDFRFVKDVFGDLRLDLDVAAALGGSLTIEDEDGNRLSKQDYDATPSLGLTIHVPL